MNWNNLSLKQKADIIKMSVLSGITDLSEIRLLYNSSLREDDRLLGNMGNPITTSTNLSSYPISSSTRPTKKALGGQVLRKNKFGEGGTIEPVDYETPWGITTRSRYRGKHTAPTSAIYFKSKEDRDAYAALLDIDLYGGVLPELEVTAKGVPTQDILTEGLDKNVQLEEKPTTQRSSYADRFFNMSDWDSLLGQTRVNLNKRAWLRNPLYMLNWTDAGNAAAAFTVAPFATAAVGEYVLPWLSEISPYLSARGWLLATLAVGNTPAWLTPTSAAFIDATLAGTATGASINDMIENGPTVENVLGTTLGGIGLAYEAYPTIMNGILAGRRAYNTFRLNRQLNKAATLFDGTVGANYFNSPSNWYRVTESPEIENLRYWGKNITTTDLDSHYSPIDDFRMFVIENLLNAGTGANEGYWMMPRKKSLFNFTKTGLAHGNTSLAAKGRIWDHNFAYSNKFPLYIIEGEGPAKVFRGFDPVTGADNRTNFVQVPWEEVPFGARIGFHTGEMPMEGLRAFRQLPNGRYLYEGPILPDKIIRVEESPLDNLNNMLRGNINKFGEGGQKIEIRRSVNGVTSPEVLTTVANEDEYNRWVLEHPEFREVPNNFITEATALLPELTVTANKDNTTSTNMSSYSNTRINNNYSFRDWWNSISSSLNRQWNDFLQYNPIVGQRRVDNFNRTGRRSPDFPDNWTLNYNNTLAPVVNMGKFTFDYLFPRPLGVLDLSNESFDQIIDPNKLYLYILVNDFVEGNPNNIRQAKDFYNTTDTLIGDNLIPLSSMPLFAGVENNKFKIDSLGEFNHNTTVVPVRSRNRPGGYTKLIPPNLRISELKQKDIREANRLMDERYPMNFWDSLTGKISRDYRLRALNYRNLVLDSLERIHGPYEIGNRWLRGITTSGDTIPITDMHGRYKAILYSPTTRRTIFTGDMSNPDNLLLINTHLKNDPSYIGIFDNGRYYHTTLNSTVLNYKAPWDNLNNMFIIGVR